VDQTAKDQVQNLITVYGADKVRAAAAELIAAKFGAVEINVNPQGIEELRKIVGTFDNCMNNVAERIERAMYRPKGIPAEFVPVIQPDALSRTIEQIDAVAAEVVAKGQAREESYQDKAERMKTLTMLETDIKLTEWQAMEQVEGTGKDQYVLVGDKKMFLSNETAREAYQGMASASARRSKANVAAEIAALDVNYRKADDAYKAAVDAQGLVVAKAHVQAALLNFLSTRQ
jgi:hypothetical protein